MREFFDIILGVFLLLIFGLLLISIGCYFLRKNADFANKSVYNEMKSDSDKLMAWFYRRYYGPNNTLPVLKTRKQSCIFMLAVTLAIAVVLLILKGDWNIFGILNDIPFFAEVDYYERIGEGSNFANYWGYLILCEGACALTLKILQMFIIDRYIGKKRFFSRDRFCFWLLSIYLAAFFGRIMLPFMRWYLDNTKSITEYTFLSVDSLYALLLVAALFISMSSGLKVILAVYVSIPLFYLYTALNLHYYILLPFAGVNRVTQHNIFTNAFTIQGIGLTVITQLIMDFIEWLPFWDSFILWLKRKIMTPKFLLLSGVISLTVAFIADFLKIKLKLVKNPGCVMNYKMNV